MYESGFRIDVTPSSKHSLSAKAKARRTSSKALLPENGRLGNIGAPYAVNNGAPRHVLAATSRCFAMKVGADSLRWRGGKLQDGGVGVERVVILAEEFECRLELGA